MNIEDMSFTKNNGVERKLSEIIEENIERVRTAYYSDLTTVDDFSVGGMNYFLAVNQSLCQYDLEFLIEATNKNNLIQYASGDALDDIGARKGLYRSDSEFAMGSVLFTLANPLSSPLKIAEGTELTTDDSIIFVTNEDAIFETGITSVVCEVICMEPGTIGNIKKGSLNNILTLLPYDLTVTNTSDFISGVDEEDDESFKERIIDSTLNYPVGTSIWYEKVAKTLVDDALYHKINPSSGKIIYKPTNGVTNDNLIALFNQKENQVVNIDIDFDEAIPKPVINENMSISVIINSQYGFESVKNNIINIINNYVDNLPLGEIFKSRCVKFLIESVEGVQAVNLSGYEDIIDLTNEEYAVIDGELIINEW